MNMKMEESETDKEGSKNKQEKTRSKIERSSTSSNVIVSDTESMKSMDEPPKDYEAMLQKYEAEVRNHIKIEQQLKLHIECVQDKLDDCEKGKEQMKKERKLQDEEIVKELSRNKDLLGLREKEIDNYKNELRRI